MEKDKWTKVETILDEALELPEGRRKAFVQRKCKSDRALKSDITLLLDSISASEGWLDNPSEYKEDFYEGIAADIEHLSPRHSLIGKQVGAYIIKEKIGEGGMGSVYLAERSDGAFKQSVAIKIIKEGKSSSDNLERFKRERQILANLNHPGIAKLLDGGITEEGFPFLIMEYVDGIPIDEFCRRNACSLSEINSLFINVLQAVSHAHENLVIHRDLKPGNILVTPDQTVKILDFGISKLLENQDSAKDLTKTHGRLLTPKYAAPEQIMEQPVTTATDLYALGIIYYSLIAGSHPFNLKDLSQHELERVVLNQPPAPPSKKVSNNHPVLQHKLRGDIDAIALKAIRKEPRRRYRVTKEFIDDLRNFDQNLPVTARGDSLRYNMSKFFKRHTKGLAIGAGIVVLFISLVSFYTLRITKERNQARFEANKATQIKNLLSSIIEQSDPFDQPDRNITLKQVLDKGTPKVEHSLNDQPAMKAELLGLLGETYTSLASFGKAESLLTEANSLYDGRNFNGEKTIYFNNLIRLGRIMYRTGRYQEAESTFKQSLKITENIPDKLPNNYGTAYAYLAAVYREEGKLEDAEKYYKKAMDTADSTEVLRIALYIGDLGNAYRDQRNFKKAIQLHKKSLRLQQQISDTINPNLATAYNNLAFTYQQEGEFMKADSLHKIALKMRRELFPPDHNHIASSLIRLGLLKIKQLEPKKAEEYLKEGYDILKKKMPASHWRVIAAKGGLAVSRGMQGKFRKNIPIVEDAYHQFKERFGIDDWRSREAALAVGNLYNLWSKPDSAKQYLSHYENKKSISEKN